MASQSTVGLFHPFFILFPFTPIHFHYKSHTIHTIRLGPFLILSQIRVWIWILVRFVRSNLQTQFCGFYCFSGNNFTVQQMTNVIVHYGEKKWFVGKFWWEKKRQTFTFSWSLLEILQDANIADGNHNLWHKFLQKGFNLSGSIILWLQRLEEERKKLIFTQKVNIDFIFIFYIHFCVLKVLWHTWPGCSCWGGLSQAEVGYCQPAGLPLPDSDFWPHLAAPTTSFASTSILSTTPPSLITII